MTTDKDLSARLAEFAKSDCRDNEFAKWCQTAWQAYSTGQLVTLADHKRAVQAAVAKAVAASLNAENEACAKMLDSEADDYEADASRFRGGTHPHHFRMNLASTARKYAAAIRSRGVV